MLPIIYNGYKRGSFRGEPHGFVNLPEGSLFARHNYKYLKKLPSHPWESYSELYYKPTQLEYENDYNGKVWFRKDGEWLFVGPFITKINQQDQPSMYLYYLPSIDSDIVEFNCGDSIDSLLSNGENSYIHKNSLTIINNGNSDLIINDISIDNINTDYVNVNLYDTLTESWFYLNTFPFPKTIGVGEEHAFLVNTVFNTDKIIDELGIGEMSWSLNIESNSTNPTCSFNVGGTFNVQSYEYDFGSLQELTNYTGSDELRIRYWGDDYGYDDFMSYPSQSNIFQLTYTDTWTTYTGTVINQSAYIEIENFNGFSVGVYVFDENDYNVINWSV